MAAAPPAAPRPRGSRHPWRWLALAAAALAVAGIDQALHPWLARRGAALGPAAWIWSRDSTREVAPRAFYLAKDFELESAPVAATLAVQGDEEYVLYLNGRRLGSNAYADGAPLDRYEVGELLVAGGNRLLAELRSSRGVGGFLLRLEAGPGGPALVVSDASWRVMRTLEPGLVAGWLHLEGGEPPEVWGVPPVGRWGRPTVGPPRPVPPPLLGRETRVPATVQKTLGGPGGAIQATLFDWGEARSGYLTLALPLGGLPPGLLFVGNAPPDPELQDADGFVLAPPGAATWRDSVPRRFRYALVLGARAPAAAWVDPLAAESLASLRTTPPAARGVFGLAAPPRRPWLEAEIRRQQRER